ncbi:SpoVR family protein [Heliophilum fasciatum]|uniref:Stage V sporulation protein R n=1 Tax=Heliophilum fasciatum TaxID=35700 RepID=A0A4R2RHJ7_9FIRM|nr:SpoVR family protein [Heliophilum fasciatum]MCW2278792.1 stage V sporulation protein R [Heliophilum fasciatum]TCP62463.1 stage V sporulation protein R [Heliophilum fasciatum]
MAQDPTQATMQRMAVSIPQIMAIARNFGLDFYDMRFEICPAEVIYTLGAYGMPTRFNHWSFGKTFHKMKMAYDFNLSRIYELVINSNPCYAFLLEGNTAIQNELIVAHVLAHCDFFKHNCAFAGTARYMVDSMAASADRIRNYEFQYGLDNVEKFLDAAMAIQEHIDPHYRTIKQPAPTKLGPSPAQAASDPAESPAVLSPSPAGASKDAADAGKKAAESGKDPVKPRRPAQPQKDLLLFIMEHGHFLTEWQQDILSIIRSEMCYFWPQMRTKVMNEGWATFWHLRIMREMDVSPADDWEWAKMHAQVVQPSRQSLNPYHLGLRIFEDIERRWGREKIFEVREMETDTAFLRNYLTRELVDELDLYLYKKVGNQWQIVEKNWEAIRDELVHRLTNAGFPTIYVEDGDENRAGELRLRHAFEGVELDIPYLERTLPHVYTLWGRTVHFETVLEGKKVLFSYNGEKVQRKYI